MIELTVLSKQTLQNIPSVSGIEIVNSSVYVIGDNSPWLFMLDDKYQLKDKWPIVAATGLVENQIPKPQKPDVEAMTFVTWGSNKGLLLFGSGSKSPERDVLIWVNMNGQHTSQTYSLEHFYESLRNIARLSKEELNIEAAVATDQKLYLFNRGKNLILAYDLQHFLRYLEKKEKIPEPDIIHFDLPQMNGSQAGFSGATITPDNKHILFTASVENTSNWIDDGSVSGSFIGLIDIEKKDIKPQCLPVVENGEAIKIKIESVAVRHTNPDGSLHLLLVTDSDGGVSELLEVNLKMN